MVSGFRVSEIAMQEVVVKTKTEENKLKGRIQHYKMKHQVVDSDEWSFSTNHPDLYKLCSKRSSLISHRTWEVRNEARATYLARAYIKGVPYKVVEAKTSEKPQYPAMESLIRMVMKYGNTYYRPDRELDENGHRSIVVKTAEKKAEDDILAWLNKE